MRTAIRTLPGTIRRTATGATATETRQSPLRGHVPIDPACPRCHKIVTVKEGDFPDGRPLPARVGTEDAAHAPNSGSRVRARRSQRVGGSRHAAAPRNITRI
jgi:hypothetical protein